MTTDRNSSRRSIAGLVLLVCFIAGLVIAARHNHLETTGCQKSSCMFCGGALAAEPTPELVVAPETVAWARTEQAPREPELSYLLRLEHSGGAPPA